jgi:hypothetical protein
MRFGNRLGQGLFFFAACRLVLLPNLNVMSFMSPEINGLEREVISCL